MIVQITATLQQWPLSLHLFPLNKFVTEPGDFLKCYKSHHFKQYHYSNSSSIYQQTLKPFELRHLKEEKDQGENFNINLNKKIFLMYIRKVMQGDPP